MGPRLFTVVAVTTLRAAAMHAVIYGIRIGEAVGNHVAMAESHDRWRRHEAKGGPGRDQHRHAKARPRAQLLQHVESLLPQAGGCKP